MRQFFSLFSFSPSLFPLSHFPLSLSPPSLCPLFQSSPPSPAAPASPSPASPSPASPSPASPSPAAGLPRQSGDFVPYNSLSYAPLNRGNYLSTIHLHWPTTTAVHIVIMHQLKPQRPSLSDINKWNQDIKHWNSQAGLWEYYSTQEQFNIIKLPILSEDEFVETAIEIATNENVTNPEEFKKKFKEEATSHQMELDKCINEDWRRTVWHANDFQCKDASEKVAAFCHNRCYMDLIQLLRGITFGWESDTIPVADKPTDDHFNGGIIQHFVDDRYQGPIGHDHEPTDNTLDSDIHLDIESTLTGKQSQRKRYVSFDLLYN